MPNRTFYASTYVVADGVTRTWPFSFAGVNTGQVSGTKPYLYDEDVKVQELYTDANGVKQTVQRDGTLDIANQITISGPPVLAGREIRIYRETELRFPLVDYRDLQSVSEHDLDLANRQAVFIAQETRDAASANIIQDETGNYDAKMRRIVNVADGIDPKDAVNLSQLSRAIRVGDMEVPVLPPAAERVGRLLSFDAAGLPIMQFPASGSALDLEARLALQGARMSGYNGGTVEGALNALNLLFDKTNPANGAAVIGFQGMTLAKWLLTNYVDVQDYGADPTGVADSTAAFAAAAATGKQVHVTEQRNGAKAIYRLALNALPNAAILIGNGVKTELHPLNPTSRAAIAINSSSATTFVDDLQFINLTFRGTSVANGFSEQNHLLTLNGVRRSTVMGCFFYEFRGDAIYYGSGDAGGQERHNINNICKWNFFDGVNHANRQGVSVIDADGLDIVYNFFQDCTKSNMPGAIDLEPDVASFHVLKNINIEYNSFLRVGGNLGVISLFLNGATIPAPEGIRIRHNFFRESLRTTSHSDVYVGIGRALTYNDIDNAVLIEGNIGYKGCSPLNIQAIRGCRIIGNTFESYSKGCNIGAALVFDGAKAAPYDLLMMYNRFIRCANAGGPAMEICSVKYFDHFYNVYEDCGNRQAGSYVWSLNSGVSSYIRSKGNTYTSPSGRTLQGLVIEATHITDAATNSQLEERFLDNLNNFFPANESDQRWTNFEPIVAGATSAGSGTYSVRFGRFQRIGKLVRYSIRVVCTAHTGTGLIRVQLPLNTAGENETEFPIGSAATSGVNGTGAIAFLNSAAVVGGVSGAANIYGYRSTAPDTLVQLTIPPNTFSLYLEGTYIAR